MDVKKAIEKRKSIRQYKDEEVSADIIKELINAVRLAPSGCNYQPWRFKIVKEKEEIEKLRKNKIFPQDFVYQAPLIIICCYDKSAIPEQNKIGKGKIHGTHHIVRGIRDLSIGSSFLILRAEELGLGTCYIGWMDKQKTKELFNLHKDIEVLFAITVGYPDEQGKPRLRKDISEIIV